jgi:hypothetical protein
MISLTFDFYCHIYPLKLLFNAFPLINRITIMSTTSTPTTTRPPEPGSGRLRLSSLTAKEREKLENLAMAKLGQAPKGGRGKTVGFQRTRLLTGNFIIHLHPHVGFFIGDVDSNSPMDIAAPPKKPTKPTTNPDILKIFCGISKDDTENTKWLKEPDTILNVIAMG